MPAEQKKAASKKAESKSARSAASKKTHAESKYEKSAKIAKVLDLIETGLSVRESCKKVDIPESTFRKNVRGNTELSAQYARARKMCADVQFDEMGELEQKCLDGEIDPKAFLLPRLSL